jgi:hypothetical protein
VTVRVQNATPHTRVHLLATHYWPAFPVFAHLSRVRDAESAWAAPKKLDALYVEGRNIGDEYRYIIDRRYATKFPGNMLERPSLLLNPWPIRTTETGTQEAKAGEEFARRAKPQPCLRARAGSAAQPLPAAICEPGFPGRGVRGAVESDRRTRTASSPSRAINLAHTSICTWWPSIRARPSTARSRCRRPTSPPTICG